MDESKKEKQNLKISLEQLSGKEASRDSEKLNSESHHKKFIHDMLSQLMRQQSVLFILSIIAIILFIASIGFLGYELLFIADLQFDLLGIKHYLPILLVFVSFLALLIAIIKMRNIVNDRINQLLAIQFSKNEIILSSLIPSNERKFFGKKSNLDLIREKSSNWVLTQLKEDNFIYAFPKDYKGIATDLEERLKELGYELKILKY